MSVSGKSLISVVLMTCFTWLLEVEDLKLSLGKELSNR